MCGINGLTKTDEQLLLRMSNATAHRGPDALGIFTSSGISLGHNRLSIIDLSPDANQPMHSPDGRYSIVFNGEIYNYRELRDTLRDTWNFKTKSDSEVLLAGYAKWGVGLLNKLRGIFAFAVWDSKEEKIVLVRDHMGVKPLYYALKDGVLFFSSELRAMVEGADLRHLSRESLATYLKLNYVPSPDTLVQGIHKLRPGHLLECKAGSVSISRYWTPEHPTSSRADAPKLQKLIETSVTRQLVSDRPVGLLLSGGIDSNVVAFHASKQIQQLRTFSVQFEMVKGAEAEAEKFNADSILAERTAAHYGTKHTTFKLSLDTIRESLEHTLESADEPIGNPTVISRYWLSKLVREEGIVVALGGDGSDELFGGYVRNRIALAAQYYQSAPRVIQTMSARTHPFLAKLSTRPEANFYQKLMAFDRSNYAPILSSEIPGTHLEQLLCERFAEPALQGLAFADAFMRADRELWLADESLAQTDRTSMAHALEVRVPFLDLDVVNYADSLSSSKKFTLFTNKKILREAYKEALPEYLFKQPKRGWFSPGAKWMRDPIIAKKLKEVLSDSYYGGLSDVFNWSAVQRMYERHQSGGYHLSPLWNVAHLQIWARQNRIIW